MSESTKPGEVIQLRLVVHASDFEEAVEFYRDRLGLAESLSVSGDDGAEVVILEAGRATLELINDEQRKFIDEVEVGREVSRKFRVAFEVRDAEATTRSLAEAGAEVVAAPTQTPWSSLNSRLEAPAGLQLTIFEELS